MDWLYLCLLLPAVVFPVVLLWGYAGCGTLIDTTISGSFEVSVENQGEGTVKVTAKNTLYAAAELAVLRRVEGAADLIEVMRMRPPFDPVFDINLPELEVYYYNLRVIDGNGNPGATTLEEKKIRTLALTPSGVTGAATGDRSIKLTWTNRSTDASHVVVVRTKTGGMPFPEELPPNTTSRDFTGLEPDTEYAFSLFSRLKAADGTFDSNPTLSVPVRTQPTAPPPPPPSLSTTFSGVVPGGGTYPALPTGTLVQRIPDSLLSKSATTRTVITLRGAAAGPVTLAKVTISQVFDGAGAYDSASDLKVVATNVTLAANETKALEVSYQLKEDKPLLVGFDFNAPSGAADVVLATITGCVGYYQTVVQEADPPAAPDGSRPRSPGWFVNTDRVFFIEKIEVA